MPKHIVCSDHQLCKLQLIFAGKSFGNNRRHYLKDNDCFECETLTMGNTEVKKGQVRILVFMIREAQSVYLVNEVAKICNGSYE